MSTHSRIQILLYDYLRGESDAQDKNEVEKHLASCKRCTAELKQLESTLSALGRRPAAASEERSPDFWKDFSFRVEQRLHDVHARHRAPVSPWRAIESFFVFDRPLAISLCSVAVLIVLAIGIWALSINRQQNKIVQTAPARQQEQMDSVREEMSRYFRKSKTLLVGITNMKLPENQSIDFSAERRASQELVHQARYLKNQPMDVRSARLIDDMERILIELANLKQDNNLPNVEIVRSGIHQGNLLFKIRMAESLYDTIRFVQARNDF